jgi:hypothetical protein
MGHPARLHCRHSSSADSPPLQMMAATGRCEMRPDPLLVLMVNALVQRRKLNLKPNFESSSSHFSLKRC